MFDFLFKSKTEEIQSYIDIITADAAKLQVSKFAVEKSIGMIAKAVAKSEFVFQTQDGRVKNESYYKFNIQPNDNETATDFWHTAVRKLLYEGECMICQLAGKYFIVDAYTSDNMVIMPETFSNISIRCNGQIYRVYKTIGAEDMICLRSANGKIMGYLKNVVNLYDKTLSAMNEMKRIASLPKFSWNVDAQIRLIEQNEDGTQKPVTREAYKQKLKEIIEKDGITIIQQSMGNTLEQMKMESNCTSEDINKMTREIFSACCMAFDIPELVFYGNITEKSDATNEFITYAVSPVAEIINDALNAKAVGKEDYLKGERIWVDLSRFKHQDILDSATSLDKLRSIGFNFDEIRQMVGYEALNTEFSQERVITKNYTDDLGGDGSDAEG